MSQIRILTVQMNTEIHLVEPEIHVYVINNRLRVRRSRTNSK